MAEDAGVPEGLRPVGDDPDEVDAAALAAVERALAEVAFLRPDGPLDPEPMPEWAWTRISDALSAEHAAAQAAAGDPPRRPSRATRWAGGLVAASVAVVAVGVGVTAFSGSGGGGAVVAGDAPALSTAGTAPMTSKQAPSAAQEAAPFAAAPEDLSQPGDMALAGMVPPTLRLIDSEVDYTRADLTRQVTDVLEDNGFEPTTTAVEEAMSEPAPPLLMSGVPADGFTRSAEDLRDCVTKLTEEIDSTALLVDRSTFEGQEAGVVVAPPDEPPMSRLEVLVVDPECDLIMSMWVSLRR